MLAVKKTLLIGIGNIGRGDDAVAWYFIDQMAVLYPEQFIIEYRYQLQIEDADLIASYQRVVFIDAHMLHYQNGFDWQIVKPRDMGSFTSHELLPEQVLYLCQSIFKKTPETHVLAISGKSFNLEYKMTDYARLNLENALAFFIQKQDLEQKFIKKIK